MATAKKTTKKVAVKKSSPRKAKTPKLESFKVAKDTKPFVSYRITEQTVYWSILLILILILSLWVLNIQINISDLLDSIKNV